MKDCPRLYIGRALLVKVLPTGPAGADHPEGGAPRLVLLGLQPPFAGFTVLIWSVCCMVH
jgi:hypothetical protein